MNTSTLFTQLLQKQTPFTEPDPLTVDMNLVASIILSGGHGSRLYPLTQTRCKPALSFGGKNCLIDVPISNSLDAKCHKIFILTQFLSSSLHRHIIQTYLQRGQFSDHVELLTAEQKPNKNEWFSGTADAVRQHLDYLLESPVEYFLILSGDQLYHIDFQEMVKCAKQTDADVVIASLPVSETDAKRMGVLKVNNCHFITDFYEKPQEKSILKKFEFSSHQFEEFFYLSNKNCYLGSMGIYLFKRDALVQLLRQDLSEDFGKHLLPKIVKKGKAAAYLYRGYWEDIGTIKSFYEANMALIDQTSKFNLKALRIDSQYSKPLFPTFIDSVKIKNAMICDGCILQAKEISKSIIGPNCMLQPGTIVQDSYLMGNDQHSHENFIGENTVIKRAIIDKNVKIGKNVQLVNKQKLMHYDSENAFIREGIIVVPQGSVIPDHFIL